MNEDRDRTYVTPLGEASDEDVAAFWDRSRRATAGVRSGSVPPSWSFGDTVELADELIALVMKGQKRATAESVAEYVAAGDPLPAVGDLSIVTDGSMRPRVLLETTEVRIGPLSSVDRQFAWDEGEGDRSLEWWVDAHTWYFTRAFARLGQEFHAEIEVVFERFAVLYHEA